MVLIVLLRVWLHSEPPYWGNWLFVDAGFLGLIIWVYSGSNSIVSVGCLFWTRWGCHSRSLSLVGQAYRWKYPRRFPSVYHRTDSLSSSWWSFCLGPTLACSSIAVCLRYCPLEWWLHFTKWMIINGELNFALVLRYDVDVEEVILTSIVYGW